MICYFYHLNVVRRSRRRLCLNGRLLPNIGTSPIFFFLPTANTGLIITTTEFRIVRSQSCLSTLAIVAMTNRRLVASSNADSTSNPRSVPSQAQQRPAGSPQLDAVKSKDGSASPSTPTSSSGSVTSSQFPLLDPNIIPPPALHPNQNFGPSAHPSSLAKALRAIDDGSNNVALPVRRASSTEDSPYTKSISSTAPASPRM